MIDDLLRQACQRPSKRIRMLSVVRTAEGWQANVSHDGDGGAYKVRVCDDPAEALREALAAGTSAPAQQADKGIFE